MPAPTSGELPQKPRLPCIGEKEQPGCRQADYSLWILSRKASRFFPYAANTLSMMSVVENPL